MKILITETFKHFVKDNFKKLEIDYPVFAQRISKKISNKNLSQRSHLQIKALHRRCRL